MTDFLTITTQNSYGDSFRQAIKEPTCGEMITGIVQAAQQLGFPDATIYAALEDTSEKVKLKIFKS